MEYIFVYTRADTWGKVGYSPPERLGVQGKYFLCSNPPKNAQS